MNTTGRALITGITGQDGSYLAELLLSLGYDVVGISRRSSVDNTERIRHLFSNPNFHVIEGDVTDALFVDRTIRSLNPDEVYNLAAQSFVGTSFEEPTHTFAVNLNGCLNCLESIRGLSPNRRPRFYQASTSEMFGTNYSERPVFEGAPEEYHKEMYQDEDTSFKPCSPYAIAKLAAHHAVGLYRKSYGLHASCGILFNHECISAETPLIVRLNGLVDVIEPTELIGVRGGGSPFGGYRTRQRTDFDGMEIWSGEKWVKLLAITATRTIKSEENKDRDLLQIQAIAGYVCVTSHHTMVRGDLSETRADSLNPGENLKMGEYPDVVPVTSLSLELAEMLGLIASEGYVAENGSMTFTNNDSSMRERASFLWRSLFAGVYREDFSGKSGFTGESVGKTSLIGQGAVGRWFRDMLYTFDGQKRVPQIVLNASPEARQKFLDGYYAGDGLKAGGGDSYRTVSPILAQGVSWLYALNKRKTSVYAQEKDGSIYFLVNVSSDQQTKKGQHLRKEPSEIRRIIPGKSEHDWVFDLETDGGLFMAGVGRIIVHNSPRRSPQFVTRKITKYVGDMRSGRAKDEPLKLGNLDARRDWGHAEDYVRAMHLMLQQDEPDDYVIATGKTRSVRDFLDAAFACWHGYNWKDFVEIDPAFLRPCEVPLLKGDASKAKRKLGWKPRVTFEQMVQRMVECDTNG